MVLLESSGGEKRNALDLQLVFNKISTFPLGQFWFKGHDCSGGREGGCGRRPRLLSTLKAIPFQENHYHFG